MADIEIKPAPRALKPELLSLSRSTYEEHRARQPWAFPDNGFEITVRPTIEAAFRAGGRSLDESPNAFAAYRNGEFAGYAVLSDWARPDGPDMPYVSIEDIHVIEHHRGHGVGRALVAHIRALARDRDWDSLTAIVWAGNEASRAMFAAEGFTTDYTRVRIGPTRAGRDYPTPPGARAPVWMLLLLGLALGLGLLALFLSFSG